AAAEPYLPSDRLADVRAVVARAGERLALSRAHTVVALAGATGSGKSSIFNGLVRADVSPVGLRRPTTDQAHACVWGPDAAEDLLHWLGVGSRHRRSTEDSLPGLVLLDLPDFDTRDAPHRL